MLTQRRLPALAALAGLFTVLPILAQVTGRLSGTVLDQTGAVVSGATVNLTLQDGQTAVFTTKTNSDGIFSMTGIRAGSYDLSAEAPGFLKVTMRAVKIDPGRETVMPAIKLELAGVAQAIEVVASGETLQTTNAEISTTVSNEQVRNLPVLDRQVLSLLTTQAGVSSGRGPTVVNGLRTSFSNVTLDGINIQDNLFRDNSLDFSPNRLAIDQVAEITVSTSNANTTTGAGASQVNLITPSGTNQFHGSAYWYNRNSAVAANDWFNNLDGLDKPQLNQNQFGGSLGGPIRRDKLLFYFNYEGLRLNQQVLGNSTVLTQDARNGIWTYRDSGGNARKVNLYQATGAAPDPYVQSLIARVPGPENINNFRLGDSRDGFLANTAGYSYNIRNNEVRDNVTSKIDYLISPKHTIQGTFVWNSSTTDRPDLVNSFEKIPDVSTESGGKLFSAGWRWNPLPSLTNELRGGFNRTGVDFIPTGENPGFLIDVASLYFDNPVNNYMPQGRKTNTYMLMDNASWMKGRHNLQFGFQYMRTNTSPYQNFDVLPTYGLGISVNNPNGLAQSSFPGISANDFNNANLLFANLAGYISGYTQDFNVTSINSGFVPGSPNLRHFILQNYAGYAQDTWRVNRRFTMNLGVRYEFFAPVDERDALMLVPRLNGGNFIQALMSNSTLDFAGNLLNRPIYNRDMNNFAPNAGLAWDLFGNSKTVLRAGYSINFVNDGDIATARNSVGTNAGLTATSSRAGLSSTLAGRPTPPTPVFQVPRTVADNFELDPAGSALAMPDPNLRNPYVQQYNIGIQHDIKGTIVEARFVGNHGVKLYRAFDYNQVEIRGNGFLDDFLRAQQNGYLALDATGTYNPAYNPAIAGSQPLPVFDSLGNRGNLASAANRQLIRQGQVATLATNYFTARVPGSDIFFRNPISLGVNGLVNYSHSSYNAFQFDVRRRVGRDLQFQVNYTYGKVLSDSLGERQTRFDPFLDANNAAIERARAPFDITHAIKGNFVYELPMGAGHRFDYRPLTKVLSGWTVGSIVTWQSGTPFSILSTRGTINRGGIRSNSNTATSLLSKSEIDKHVGFFQTPNGPYFVSPDVIGPDGRGVSADGTAPFQGQIFYNPNAGTVGALQRRMFSGPWNFNWDLSVRKLTRITERHSVEVRMESFNLFNNPSFYVGDEATTTTRFNVNQPTFGVINSTLWDSRRIQFGLYYRF